MNYFQLVAKQKLYNAALQGDVQCLLNLLQDDPLVLDRCIIHNTGNFMQSPLHVAANIGHLEFTREILSRKPELAEELDQIRKWSPLHMASAKGHLEIVKVLLSVKPDVCFARDTEGLNPVHVAAIRGEVQVLDELLKVVPQAARERTNTGVSVLHLCVKHRQIGALKFLIKGVMDDIELVNGVMDDIELVNGVMDDIKLVNGVMDDVELINGVDGDGKTILHLAVATKQIEIAKFLLENEKMDKNVVNKYGLTARDIHQQRHKEADYSEELWVALKEAKAKKAKTVQKHKKWVKDQSGGLMVVASLIATMAFQVGLNPPGGYWQEDDDKGHKAGHSIMADIAEDAYNILLFNTTVGFISSLSVIVLLISGLPWRKVFVAILSISMWIAMAQTASIYLLSVFYLSSDIKDESDYFDFNDIGFAIYATLVWQILLRLLLGVHGYRLVMKMFNRFFPRKVHTLWRKIVMVVSILVIIALCSVWTYYGSPIAAIGI